MKKYFIAALALASVVACSKDDVSDPMLDTSKKSVAISIANMETSTRAAEAGETNPGVDGTVCTTIDEEFYFMFADDAGNIQNVFKGSDLTADTNGDYLFHGIPQTVTQVAAIGNHAGAAPAVGEKISKYSDLWTTETTATVSASYTSLLVYGDDHLTNTGGFCEVTTGSNTHRYHLYEAQLTVAPYMSRIEIEHIGCTDFGNYDKIAISGLSLAAGNYVKSFAEFTSDADLTDAAKSAYVLTAAHSHGNDTNYLAPASDKVWSWNIAPQNVTNLITRCYVYDQQTALTVPFQTVTINKYSEGSTEIHKFESGVIYRFAIDFSHKNFDGSEDNYICAIVDVNIAKWTVKAINVDFNTK